MKFLRKGLSILIITITVIILAVVAFCMLVDTNRLKPIIIAEVSKQTGYQLTVDGNFSWTFYPRVGVKAESMQFTAPQQKAPFVTMRQITLGMDFLQLLHGKSNLTGNVHIKELVLMNMHAQNVSADVLWEKNVLTLSPISASLYHGWMSGTVHGRQLNAVPRWDWDMQFSRVKLKPLLRDLSGKESKIDIEGIGQLRMRARTQGTNKAELINNMQGDVKYGLTKGAVTGLDLNYLIVTAVELINRQPVSPPADTMQTSFESFTGTMQLKNANAHTTDTILVAPAFTVKATGDINFNRQTLDYSLDVVPLQSKWSVPVLVTGDLHNPSVKLDMLKIKTMMATEQIQRVREKAEDKLKQLSPKIDNFLQKVLGN